MLLSLGLSAGLVSGCALEMKPRSANSLVRECLIPDDQSATVPYQWKAKPIPVQLNRGDFSSAEAAQIMAAADTWNSFYGATRGFASVDYGSPQNVRTTSWRVAPPDPATLCNSTDPILQNGNFLGAVTIYKQGLWPSGYPSAAIAITTKCSRPGKPRLNIVNAMIELNYQQFFVAQAGGGTRVPDLQSVVLHELGHLYGLEHSCEVGGGNGVPDCRAPGLPYAYYQAVLYPSFSFDLAGNGQVKRQLGKNDQGRANCLFP